MPAATTSTRERGVRRPRAAARAPRPRRTAARGIVIAEVIGFLGLTLALLTLLTILLVQYAQARRELDTRQELYLAAAATLQHVRAGLTPVGAEQTDLPAPAQDPRTDVRVTTTPGTATWAGFTRVDVVASRRISGERVIQVELSGYVPDRRETGP